ncbi:MAG: hypothetical protein ACYCT1_08595 [Steroidobacteraceae bacterium]
MGGVATYQVAGPGGALYSVQGPPDADPSEILAAMHGQAAAQSASPSGGWLNAIALGGREVGEGVFDTLAAPHDIGVDLQNAVTGLSNRYLGTHIAPQHTIAGQLSRALTFLGAPVPRTPDQQLAASAIRGTTGALTGMGALGVGGLANAVRATLSGASGGASADVARQAGAGPVGQFVAGTVGGLAPTALEASIGTIPRVIAPFTRAGQAQLAANTLVREATDPVQAAANLSTAEPLVPGSLRTTGEASGDTGLLALEKGIRARNPAAFGERISQQNAARQAELAAVGGTPADIAAAQTFRENETAPMRESAFAASRGQPMTLFRGERPGATGGYMNGGALWTTPDRSIAEQYAADQLGPRDVAAPNGRGAPGPVHQYNVRLRRPYVLTQDKLPEFARFFAPGEAESGGYLDVDGSVGDRPGLIGLSSTARQNLLDQGYDSVIAHAEAVRPEGEPPSVILLKPPGETPAPSAADLAPTLAKRNYATSDASHDSVLQWLAKHPRGLDSTEAQAQGLDQSQFAAPESMVGIKRAFRRGGMSFDEAAEALHQAGYPVADERGNYDPNVLLDAIDGELRGNPVYSTANTRRLAELEQQMGDENPAQQVTPTQPAQTFPGRAPVKQVHDVIDELLASPAGARESIGKTLRWAKGLIGENDDPETLYELRKDLALSQRDQLQPGGRDAPNATMLAQARGQLGKVIGSLDDAIESAAPGYKDYLSRYSELSEPVDQMSAIQDLQKRTSSGLDTATGEPFLSGPQFARQLRSTLERADGPFSPRLTPEQTQRLEAVREDLQRAGAVGNPTVRTPGSDTFQNFMTGQRTGSGLLSHVPVLGKFLGPVSKYVDSRVNAQLSDAMLNPERAAQLLRQGTLPMPVRLAMARGLSRAALPATTGPLAALARPTASTGLLPHPSAITAWLEQRLSPLTGLSPAVAPSNALQALGMTIEPARWAQEVNSGRANPAMEDKLAGLHGSFLRGHVHRLLGNARSGAVRGPGGVMHMRQGPGRHVTVLPPGAAGGVPQVLSGIVSMSR